MCNECFFKKYGVDISCKIKDILEEFDDGEKINTIKLILDNLEMWWGDYISCKQEEIEYNKLKEIIEKLEELQKIRKDYLIERLNDLKEE